MCSFIDFSVGFSGCVCMCVCGDSADDTLVIPCPVSTTQFKLLAIVLHHSPLEQMLVKHATFITILWMKRWWCGPPSKSVSSWTCSLDMIAFIMSSLSILRIISLISVASWESQTFCNVIRGMGLPGHLIHLMETLCKEQQAVVSVWT